MNKNKPVHDDLIELYRRLIETGQDLSLSKEEQQSSIYRVMKRAYNLGDGNWDKGRRLLMGINTATLIGINMSNSENLARVENEKMLAKHLVMKFMSDQSPFSDYKKKKSKAHFTADETHHVAKVDKNVEEDDDDPNKKIKDHFAYRWIDRGWVRQKGFNMTDWLNINDAPDWLNSKALNRHIKQMAEDEQLVKVGRIYERKK